MTEEKTNEIFFAQNFVHEKEIEFINPKTKTKEKYVFEFKELTGFDEDSISQKSLLIDSKTGKVRIDTSIANNEYLKSTIVKAPFPLNDETLKQLPASIRNKLLEVAKKINSVDAEIEKK